MNDNSTRETLLYVRVDIGGAMLRAGGSVAHMLGVIDGFVRDGSRVIIASSSCGAVLHQWFSALAIHELALPRLCTLLRWKGMCLVSNVLFSWQIVRAVRTTPIDHVYQRHAPLSIVGAFVAWWLSVPLILEYNGSEIWMARNWNTRSWFSLAWLFIWCEKQSLHAATTIVVVSLPMRDELVARGIPQDKILVQPNGVDPQLFDGARLSDTRKTIRQALGIAPYHVFGFIGTFSPWHGIHVLARMIPEVLRREPASCFLLMGDGPLKAWLEDELHIACGDAYTRVYFTGLVAQHDAPGYLAACDTFLLPTQPNADGSPFFGSPIKLFEYMSMGRPIIASSIAQVAELLAPCGKEQCAFLVDPRDHEGFIAAACQVQAWTVEQRDQLGVRTRARVLKHHTWSTHVQAIKKHHEHRLFRSNT